MISIDAPTALRTARTDSTPSARRSRAIRIFMALKLAESAEFDQLLYVDSDSVISHGFDGLLALELDGVDGHHVLRAREDGALDGVDAEIAGLRLDLDGNDIPAAIGADRAVAAHDCAGSCRSRKWI